MTANLGDVDRAIRVVLGAALLLFAFIGSGSSYSYIGWIGIIPLATGIIGWCGLYKMLGFSTAEKSNTSG